MKRFIAHYMLAGGDGEQVRSDTIEGLWKFIESRISAVKSSSGGRSLCVGDTKSNSADWLWRMESGGTITYSHGKYGKIAALLFGGYSPAKDLRSIPSEKRSDASRTNGKKGGRPRTYYAARKQNHGVVVASKSLDALNAWLRDHRDYELIKSTDPDAVANIRADRENRPTSHPVKWI